MWEKISKEMQLPWRAAEAMHWQIGEIEMAQRANVPVFHLAGQQGSGASHMGSISDGRPGSTSPSLGPGPPSSAVSYSHTHKHSLPQIHQPMSQPHSPTQSRLRRNSSDSSPIGPSPIGPDSLRRRNDSVRSISTISGTPRTFLPPVGELAAPPSQARLTLPPVVTSTDAQRR